MPVAILHKEYEMKYRDGKLDESIEKKIHEEISSFIHENLLRVEHSSISKFQGYAVEIHLQMGRGK